MKCNVAIKDNRLRPCVLEKGHSGPHEYEKDTKVKFRTAKNNALLLLGQLAIWGGFVVGLSVGFGIEAYDSGYTSVAVLVGFFSGFGFMIGIINVCEHLEKKWELKEANLHHDLLPEDQK